MVEGCPIEISEDTIVSFRRVSEEFDVEALGKECSAFESLHPQYSEYRLRQARTIAVLESRVSDVLQTSKVQQKKLSNQERLFESEQMHRRGCEYLFGTNGFGIRGEYLSKTLGLSLLKSAADLGHVDAQYHYGQYVLLDY
jgi:hypothetical protein